MHADARRFTPIYAKSVVRYIDAQWLGKLDPQTGTVALYLTMLCTANSTVDRFPRVSSAVAVAVLWLCCGCAVAVRWLCGGCGCGCAVDRFPRVSQLCGGYAVAVAVRRCSGCSVAVGWLWLCCGGCAVTVRLSSFWTVLLTRRFQLFTPPTRAAQRGLLHACMPVLVC